MKSLIRNNIEGFVEMVDSTATMLFEDSILVNVLTVGLCRTDLFVAQGTIGTDKDKIVLGHEFCGRVAYDPKGIIESNTLIGFNPLVDTKFMGLDFNGALAEQIWIPRSHVITVSKNSALSYKEIAYLEPVAASAAALKVLPPNSTVLIIGTNRIGALTKIILESEGHNVVFVHESELSSIPDNSFEYVLETVMTSEVVKEISRILVEGGTWILKSRKKTPVDIITTDFISKEIIIRSVNYYDFNKTMAWLEKNHEKINYLLGKSYSFSNWDEAFKDAMSNEKHKIFIDVSQ